MTLEENADLVIGEEAEFIFHAVAKIGKKKELVLAELQRRRMLDGPVRRVNGRESTSSPRCID